MGEMQELGQVENEAPMQKWSEKMESEAAEVGHGLEKWHVGNNNGIVLFVHWSRSILLKQMKCAMDGKDQMAILNWTLDQRTVSLCSSDSSASYGSETDFSLWG